MGHLDPEDAAASLAHGRRQAVDCGHDVARRRDRCEPYRVVHKRMLQVDDDEHRPDRVEIGERVLHAALLDHAPHDRVGDGRAV